MIEKTSWSQLQPLYRYVRQQAENKKFMKYLEIGATFALIAMFLFFAIQPTASAISKLIGEINSKQLLISQSKAKINSILIAQAAYSDAQEKYQIIASGLPDNPRFYQAANNFYSMANLSSVDIKNINFVLNDSSDSSSTNSQKNSSASNTFALYFSGVASYPQSLDLIKKILQNRRLVDITNIQINQIDSKTSEKESLPSNQINLSLSSNLFYSNSSNEKN